MQQFGGKVRSKDVQKYKLSDNWKNGKFENLVETKMDMSFSKLPKLLKDNFTKRKERIPQSDLKIIPFDKALFNQKNSEPKFIWYGHSVCLLQLEGKNILIDPMFGENASPIAPFATKRFSKNSLAVIKDLPEIDLVLQTHDHYDHLDLESVMLLRSKVKQWFVGLGISRHLEKWGVKTELIKEFDWWNEVDFAGTKIIYTPSRHFSGRGAFDRAKSLWGGWILKSSTHNIYWSGDGGYGEHFKKVGNRYGPFNLGFMECGQYNEQWHAIHMYPEESVQAALDAKVEISVPVHWGGFSLALHHWKEPADRFVAEAKKKNIKYATPEIGAIVLLSSEIETHPWWKEID